MYMYYLNSLLLQMRGFHFFKLPSPDERGLRRRHQVEHAAPERAVQQLALEEAGQRLEAQDHKHWDRQWKEGSRERRNSSDDHKR